MPSTSTPTALRRRDLLLLRATPRDRVFELSCQRLYMQFVDARRIHPAPLPEEGGLAAPSPFPDDGDLRHGLLGEPDAVPDTCGPRELFDALAGELGAADVLRLLDREWLADPELRREIDMLVAAFTARGGRVEET